MDGAVEWTARSLADEFREVGAGWVVRSRSLSRVHSLNRLQVRVAADPKDVVALADAHLSDLPYRHLEVDDEGTAAALEDALVTPERGWKVDREVYMVLGAPPESRTTREDGDEDGEEDGDGDGDGDARPDALVRLNGEEMDALMRRWLLEERVDAGALDELSEYNRREGALWNEVVLGVREAGVPVALTKSRSHGGVGWVEDVYTVPGARRKGYARLLVSHAIALARAAAHELTFIVADDNDWPKHLYAELGFEPVGCTWTFHCDLPR